MKKILFALFWISLLLLFNTPSFAKDYVYETVDNYIYHHFQFSEDEMNDMAKGPFKAKEYAEWMIEEMEDAVAGLETSKAKLEFKLTSLARYAEREGVDILQVELRSSDKGDGTSSVEYYDTSLEMWKDLTE